MIKILLGILFPPYGIYLIIKGNKIETTSKNITDNISIFKKFLTKTVFTLGKFKFKMWMLVLISVGVFGNLMGSSSKKPVDLVDLSGTYNFEKSRVILGEKTSMKSTLNMKKDSNTYTYFIDQVTWTGYGNVIGRSHFEGTMSDKISSEYSNTLEQYTYEWKLLGDTELIERGGYFELSKNHFNIKKPSETVYLHLSFSEGRGDSQSFKRE